MKKIWILILAGALTTVYSAGCGSLRRSKKADADLAAVKNAVIKGEDIPLSGIPGGDFTEPEEIGITGVFEDIHFSYDKSNINENDYPVMNRIGEWMKKHSGVSLMIEGHCDERGSSEYNMALGEQRALSARRYLAGFGTDPERIYTISYGEEKPLDAGHNETAWRKNRRAHFLISR